jgi:hypothetical protein
MPPRLKLALVHARERASARRAEALALRLAGKSYRAIGAELGVSECQAHRDIAKTLADLAAKEQHLTKEMRQLDLARIDKGIAGLTAAYERGEPAAVSAMVKLLERRARLLGLDAPQRHAHGGDEAAPPIQVAVDHYTQAERADRIGRLLQLAESRARVVPALPPPAESPSGNGHVYQHDGAGGIAGE